MGIPSQFES